MGYIKREQWEAISDIVLSMNGEPDITKLRSDFLQNAKRLFSYDRAIFDLGSCFNTKISYFNPTAVNIDASYVDSYYQKYKSFDPITCFFSPNECRTYRESDILNVYERNEDALYTGWMLPQDIRFSMNSIISQNGVFFGTVNFWNSEANEDFSDNTKAIMDGLSHHLSACLYNRYPNGISKRSMVCEDTDMQSHYNLTRRESDVVNLICAGEDVRGISKKLFISQSTVNKHLYNVFRKLKIKKRSELVRLFLEETGQGN
jgi:DNA-binding CsgD family transcriptional regulator